MSGFKKPTHVEPVEIVKAKIRTQRLCVDIPDDLYQRILEKHAATRTPIRHLIIKAAEEFLSK